MTLTINKKDSFFIALCKDSNEPHSFVMLGHEHQKKQQILGSFGKYFTRNASPADFYFKNEAQGQLLNESLIKKEISYKAYSLSYHQYIAFLGYLKKITAQQKKEKQLFVFCPLAETETNVDLTLQPLSELSLEKVGMSEAPSENNASADTPCHCMQTNNTCRHSAIHLVKKATHLDDLGQGVSSSFWVPLPLEASIQASKTTSNLLILPLPPAFFPNASQEQLAMLTIVYKRLDKLITCEPTNELTRKKFNKISKLYHDLTKEADLAELFDKTTHWANKHKVLIGTHRTYYWFNMFRSTASETMVKNLDALRPMSSPS